MTDSASTSGPRQRRRQAAGPRPDEQADALMRPGSRLLLGVAAALVAAAVAIDVVAPVPEAAPPEPVPQEAAAAGMWYCPVTATEEATATVTVAAVSDEASEVALVRYPDGEPVADDPQTVDPGEPVEFALEAGEADTPVAVRWSGAPAVASWHRAAADSYGATCSPEPAPQWHMAGLDTAGGSESTIHLFNPFGVDAVARISFATPEGRVALVLTDNLVVEAGSSLTVDVNEVQPEEPDLGAVVETRAGRLVASGEVSFDPATDEPRPVGRSVVPAVTDLALDWALGYARSDDRSSSWLTILNPGDREAAVQVSTSDPSPDSPILGEQSVPAGGVLRLDLSDASEAEEFGVRIESVNEVPIAVARSSDLRVDDRQGVAVAAAGRATTTQALVGAGADDRVGQISLFNPGAEPRDVRVDAGPETPEDWLDITLEPNERLALSLNDAGGDRSAIAPLVTASGPVIAEVRSFSRGEGLGSWTATGAPASQWTGPTTRMAVRRDRALATMPLVREAEDEDPLPDPPQDPPVPDEPDVEDPGDADDPDADDPDADSDAGSDEAEAASAASR